MNQQQVLQQIVRLAEQEPELLVVWLYGSRARNTAHSKSDYDLAVAFVQPLKNRFDNRLRPEELAIKWQEELDVEVSVLDINLAPIPLAMAVVEDETVIFGNDTMRSFKEEQRIRSMWELDYLYDNQAHV
jgi:predicted nucleotidyltransferase